MFDVAVIGLGAMGSAALYHLCRRGRRVVGIERFQPGHDRGSSHGESRAIRLGYSENPAYVPLARRAFETWRELEREAGKTVLTVTGILEAGKPGSAMVAGSLQACQLHDLEHEVLDAGGIMRRFPAVRVPADYTAVFQPQGGFVRPELGNALHLRGALSAGATVLTDTTVLSIEPGSSSVAVMTDRERIEAQKVVVASGPWIADLVPELRSCLTLTRQVLCWYEPLQPELFGPGALPVFMIEGEDDLVYGFPDIGQGMKCASHLGSRQIAHADLAAQDAAPADEMRTRRFLEAHLPSGAGRLRGMKTCLYTTTPDEDFVIDLSPRDRRIVVASPCSGHGYKFAGVIGEILADLAIRESTGHDIRRFAIDRPALRA